MNSASTLVRLSKKHALTRFRSALSTFAVCPPPRQQTKVFPNADFTERVAPVFGYAKVVNVAPGKIRPSASLFRATDAMKAVEDTCQASRRSNGWHPSPLPPSNARANSQSHALPRTSVHVHS